MTTATAPTPTDAAPAGEPSAVTAADTPVTPAPNAEPTADAQPTDSGNTLLTKQAPPQESPKSVALEVTLPKDSPLDPAILPRITDLAQQAGVTDAAKAQAFVDLLHGEVATALDALKKGGAAYQAMVEKMEAEALAHPKLGANDPVKLTQAVTEAKAVVDRFAPEGFAEYLDESGLGSDPRFLLFARTVYAGMREDRLVQGGPPAPKPKTAAQKMYPSLPSKEG